MLLHPLDLDRHACKVERITGHQSGGEIFFDLPQMTAIFEAQRDHRRVYDNARIHPMLADELRVRDPPYAVRLPHDPAIFVIGFERVTAIGDEMQHALELGMV